MPPVYLVGGKVTFQKIIPRFWPGEFGRAWITPAGLTEGWQAHVMTPAPYILDPVRFSVALIVLRRVFSANAFAVGRLFMLFCLWPADLQTLINRYLHDRKIRSDLMQLYLAKRKQ